MKMGGGNKTTEFFSHSFLTEQSSFRYTKRDQSFLKGGNMMFKQLSMHRDGLGEDEYGKYVYKQGLSIGSDMVKFVLILVAQQISLLCQFS
jgi:hypothetical protein